MNKKFSTLMAGLMLASAFSVASAQDYAKEYENGKYYLLGNSTNGYISVESEAGATYGKLSVLPTTTQWSLETTREALWKVTVTKGDDGVAPKYSFVNVATGMTLSVPTPTNSTPVNAVISGQFMEWLNGGANSFENASSAAPLYSYIDSKNIVYLTLSGTQLQVKKEAYSATALSNALAVQPWKAETVNLTADDLNKELITNNAVTSDSFFNLTFDQDVTEGAENLFAGVNWVAKPVGTTTYVRLQNKDTKQYLMVDTALHTGSEAEKQLPKFTYVANPDAIVVERTSGRAPS